MTSYHRRRVSTHTRIARAALAVAALLVLASIVVAVVQTARAHGTADWIQHEPAFTMPNGAHCCSPDHCRQFPDGAVTEVRPGRWFVPATGQFFTQDDPGVYPARKAGFWGCWIGGKVVCFFWDGGAT